MLVTMLKTWQPTLGLGVENIEVNLSISLTEEPMLFEEPVLYEVRQGDRPRGRQRDVRQNSWPSQEKGQSRTRSRNN